jgi:Ca2+-dependent lipid-binding protein
MQRAPLLTGLLYVQLVKGESLVSKDVNGLSDPYFKLKLKVGL